MASGALLIAVGGLGAAALYSMNAEHRAVVVMASDVRRGDAIAREDLAVLEIPASLTVDALGAADLPALVGQRSLTDLPRGAFPLTRHVGEDPLPAGQSLVGLRLPLGKLPTADMPPGTAVRLVGLVEGVETSVDAVVGSAPVLLDDGASYSLDVSVQDGRADEVARLSASDMVALVVVGGA
ncbi:SAF domain-containing protein [Tessaracoccus sp. Z1128]